MTIADSSHSTTRVLRLRDGQRHAVDDQLAVEEPLEIRLGYTDAHKGRVHKSVAITMRTPGDDIALAMGFLHAESIIHDIALIDSVDDTSANVLRLELHPNVRLDPIRLERHFYTTSSCGVCGKASLEALSLSGFDTIADNRFTMNESALLQLPNLLREQQSLFKLTGGNHATALFDASGKIALVKEDVGRHNAMDKLVGTLLQQGRLPMHQHGILVSGRASFELLQKALAAGCPMLVAVGAPSSLAVELAEEFDITLVGFVGKSGFNVYHGSERILAGDGLRHG
ncbi:MAG TPA: formate dehydrogenase accessory sulfurtransferase FdhD [Pseudomonadaceae bacterium]|nr:formate dehydrogenase accessory sulfurtransferase FdhD [Pseudomonadaceae bacterium]